MSSLSNHRPEVIDNWEFGNGFVHERKPQPPPQPVPPRRPRPITSPPCDPLLQYDPIAVLMRAIAQHRDAGGWLVAHEVRTHSLDRHTIERRLRGLLIVLDAGHHVRLALAGSCVSILVDHTERHALSVLETPEVLL